jgi:DNA-binding transcriptional MerR regulator
MSVATRPSGRRSREGRRQTIGAVCRRLKTEFPDISISKIRYLEDQGLLAPKRTPGGYRLFDEPDVERLERILRLQRDEFLPLRVIRQELTASVAREARRPPKLAAAEPELELRDVCERAGVTPGFVRELEDFGLIEAQGPRGHRRYTSTDVLLAELCQRLAKFGMSARHLRTFRTTADREVALLAQVMAAGLHSRSPERRRAAVDDLDTLATVSQELGQLLFWRDVRRLAGE